MIPSLYSLIDWLVTVRSPILSASFNSSTSTFYAVVSGSASLESFVAPMNVSLFMNTSIMTPTSVQPQWALARNSSNAYQSSMLTFSVALPVTHSTQGALFVYTLAYTLTGQSEMANVTSASVALSFYSLFLSVQFIGRH